MLAQAPLHGGCLARVTRLTLADGTMIVAKEALEPASDLTLEAWMLQELRRRAGLPVPRVLAACRDLLLFELAAARFPSAEVASMPPPSAMPPSWWQRCTRLRGLPSATSGTRPSGLRPASAWSERWLHPSSATAGCCCAWRTWRAGGRATRPASCCGSSGWPGGSTASTRPAAPSHCTTTCGAATS
ncbi:MAG: hypothetical protein U1E17_04675 [Geminicoccaceae bacterium]